MLPFMHPYMVLLFFLDNALYPQLLCVLLYTHVLIYLTYLCVSIHIYMYMHILKCCRNQP